MNELSRQIAEGQRNALTDDIADPANKAAVFDAAAMEAKIAGLAEARRMLDSARLAHTTTQIAMEEAERVYSCAKSAAIDELGQQAGIEKYRL